MTPTIASLPRCAGPPSCIPRGSSPGPPRKGRRRDRSPAPARGPLRGCSSSCTSSTSHFVYPSPPAIVSDLLTRTVAAASPARTTWPAGWRMRSRGCFADCALAGRIRGCLWVHAVDPPLIQPKRNKELNSNDDSTHHNL